MWFSKFSLKRRHLVLAATIPGKELFIPWKIYSGEPENILEE